MEVFIIHKLDDGVVSLEAKQNSKDLEEADIKKIDELIALWKRMTVKQLA